MSNMEETMFGRPEWSYLVDGAFTRVSYLTTLLITQPLDSLLHYYSRMTNIISRCNKIQSVSIEEMNGLMDQLNTIKGDLAQWKKRLPAHYEPISVPIPVSEEPQSPTFGKYPYDTRFDYVTSTLPLRNELTQFSWATR